MQLRIISQFCYTVNAIFPVSAFFMQIFLFTQGGMAARRGRAPRDPQKPARRLRFIRPRKAARRSLRQRTIAPPKERSQQSAGMQIGRRMSAAKAALARLQDGCAAETFHTQYVVSERGVANIVKSASCIRSAKGSSSLAAFAPFSLSAFPRTKQSTFLPSSRLLFRQTVPRTPLLHVGKTAMPHCK